MRFLQSFVQLIGRFCIAALFILAGVEKILSWDQTVEFMRTQGLADMTEVICAATIFLEVFGGLCFAFGLRRKFFATLLALFLIPTTYVFHNFWDLTDPVLRQEETVEFLKNLAIFGGLLCFIATPSAKEPSELG
ncbi:MAG: hypothetical protein JWO53_542 [Chlamydiia bacterium]|nr:hypothetical protein [Chlamydiia bacterium]